MNNEILESPSARSFRPFTFTVSPDVNQLGVKAIGARIRGVANSLSHPDFETYKKSELERVRATWAEKDLGSVTK
jgi:hypothetical protein